MRQRIEAGFGAPVIDFYDSHEFNMIAWQRPGTGYYQLAAQSVISEVLQDGHPVEIGEQGEFVGTALHSWAMPFIRFRLGDIVTRGEAPSTLKEIQGVGRANTSRRNWQIQTLLPGLSGGKSTRFFLDGLPLPAVVKLLKLPVI
jgi:phenylacetate-coenzyme A ligase PaaK-like adenylate-forming protein